MPIAQCFLVWLLVWIKLISTDCFPPKNSDDYRLTAAISILKWVTERYENGNHGDKLHKKDSSDPPKTPSSTHRNVSTPRRSATPKKPSTPSAPTRCSSRESSSNVIPVKALTLALEACRDFLRCREHLDIDDPVNKVFFKYYWNKNIIEILFTWSQEYVRTRITSVEFSTLAN